MSKFITRIELHDADSKNYEKLHEEMEIEGFTRTIQDGTTKKWYHLPDAIYRYDNASIDTTNTILEKAIRAANKANKENSILVTKSEGSEWSNLKEVK